MRVVIASRIYSPEVSAASGLLQSWAEEFRNQGCHVTVVTSRPPRGMVPNDEPGVHVRRAPVLRDRQNYVRGYLSYLSFDIPLLFRLLFSRRPGLYVVEPPPTTTAVVTMIARLRRVPVVVDAADLWSDAASMVTRNRVVLGALRAVELWGLRRAKHLFAAHGPLAARFTELGISTPVTAIGFGADTRTFQYREEAVANTPVFVYAGTYSEWHGAGIFIDAFAEVLRVHPRARLIFVGNGSDRDSMRARAKELGVDNAVEFRAPVAPAELSPLLASATVSLASLKPGQGYDYAFTTKVYSSIAAGCPVVFAGVGPTVEFFANSEVSASGVAVDYTVSSVAEAMLEAAAAPLDSTARSQLASWAAEKYSFEAIAQRVVTECLAIAQTRGTKDK